MIKTLPRSLPTGSSVVSNPITTPDGYAVTDGIAVLSTVCRAKTQSVGKVDLPVM